MNNDDKQQNQTNKAVPSDLSDHDERSEELAVDKHWDQESDDAMATAGKRLSEFIEDGVPLSDKDWEKEEEKDDEIPGHIEEAIDDSVGESLEALAEEELNAEE